LTALQPRGISCIDHRTLDGDLGKITTRDVVICTHLSISHLMSIHGHPRGNLHAPTRLHMTRRMLCYMATRFSRRMMGQEIFILAARRMVPPRTRLQHTDISREAMKQSHAHVPMHRRFRFDQVTFAGRDSQFHRRHRFQPPRLHHKSSPRSMARVS
jgi:hypothetical protein